MPVVGDWRISGGGTVEGGWDTSWGRQHLHRKRLEAKQTHSRGRCLLRLTDDLLPDVLTTDEDHLYRQVLHQVLFLFVFDLKIIIIIF